MTVFTHLLTDQCIISRYTGTTVGNAFARPTYGAKETIRCAFAEGFTKVRDADGKERVTTHQIATSIRIGLKDRVWLPTENGVTPASTDDNNAKLPIAIKNDRSRISGRRFYVAFFG